MDLKELKQLEDEIDVKVEEIINAVDELERLVSRQPDRAQRHTDQSEIHDIIMRLYNLQTDRPDH